MEDKSLFTSRSLFYVILLLFTISVGFNLVDDNGSENLYVLQAKAFADGRLNVDQAINDVAVYEGEYFVTFPPFPAFLITPLVAIFGELNTTLVAFVITIGLLFILWSLFKRLELDNENSYWLMMAMVFGTGYWFVSKFSFGVWSFAHVVAVSLIFLSIREAFGKKRAWLMAIFLGCAFLTRQLSLYTSVFMIAVIIDKCDWNWKQIFKEVAVFGLVFSLFASVYLYLNYLRFDNPFDTGYFYIAGDPLGLLGEKRYGLFHYKYIPFNFIYMFLQGPHITFDGLIPTGMDFYGTSLTFASPFVFLAFKARGNQVIIAGAVITILLCLCHMMLYCNNGWVQINTQRFTLDFLPMVMVLLAFAVKQIPAYWVRLTVSIAVILNLVAFLMVPFLINFM